MSPETMKPFRGRNKKTIKRQGGYHIVAAMSLAISVVVSLVAVVVLTDDAVSVVITDRNVATTQPRELHTSPPLYAPLRARPTSYSRISAESTTLWGSRLHEPTKAKKN